MQTHARTVYFENVTKKGRALYLLRYAGRYGKLEDIKVILLLRKAGPQKHALFVVKSKRAQLYKT